MRKYGDPYMPSNGSEGTCFTHYYCGTCIYQHPNPENERQCNDVLLESLLGNQPPEWIYGEDLKPTCTKYVKFDWGNDEDGWNDPDPNIDPLAPIDPFQLLLPFDIIDLFGFELEGVIMTKKAIFEKELLAVA